jgi:hypothetical protein
MVGFAKMHTAQSGTSDSRTNMSGCAGPARSGKKAPHAISEPDITENAVATAVSSIDRRSHLGRLHAADGPTSRNAAITCRLQLVRVVSNDDIFFACL